MYSLWLKFIGISARTRDAGETMKMIYSTSEHSAPRLWFHVSSCISGLCEVESSFLGNGRGTSYVRSAAFMV